MEDNQIDKEAIKSLAGIDSLYFFINTDCVEELYYELYQNQIVSNQLFDTAQYQSTFLGFSGKSKGFVGSWYEIKFNDIPICKIGIKDPSKQKNINNLYLQLIGAGIYSHGLLGCLNKVITYINILLSSNFILDDCIVSRLDINTFVGGVDFRSINAQCFKSSYMEFGEINSYSDVNEIYTLYLGSQKSAKRFKIYNKVKELMDKQSSLSSQIKKQWFINQGFNPCAHLWNLEWTYKREFLRNYGLMTVKDIIDSFYSLLEFSFNDIRFLGFDSDKYKKLRKSSNIGRLKPHWLWSYLLNNAATNINDCFGNKTLNKLIKTAKKTHKEYYITMINSYIEKATINGYIISTDDIAI